MEEVRGSSPLQPTISTLPSREPLPEAVRIACDHCAVEEAVIDHLDLTRHEGQLQRLCRPCADAEKARWDQDRARGPLAGFALRGRAA
jgi:hypothetical protein